MKKTRIRAGRLVFPFITVVIIISVILLIAYRPEPEHIAALPEQLVTVTVERVEPRSLPDIIILPGKTKAFDDVTIAAEQSGRIISTTVTEGDMVNEGDILLNIDDRLWQSGLRRAELSARDAGRDLDRIRELRQTGAVSQSDLEAAETRAEAAAIALYEARIQVERCKPTAVMDAIVEQRWVSAGEYVNHGQPLFRLIDTSMIKIIFDVPERDVKSLRLGESYRFFLDALPETIFDGRLEFVSAAANPRNNSFKAEIRSKNPEHLIRAGMITRVEIVRRSIENAVILPLRAVVPMKGESIVYLVKSGHAERRIVRIGTIVDGQAVILEGIDIGDEVILDGNRSVLDGTPVTINNVWQPAPFMP